MRLLLGILWLFLLGVGHAQANSDGNVKVAILFFDGVQIIDFAAPYEVFGQAKYEVLTVSKDGNAVKTAMNLTVAPDYSFASLPQVDLLVVPGGNVHEAMHDADTQQWLSKLNASVQHTLSVCTGSHILAEAGLLDGLTSTTFHRALNSFEENYPKTKVIRDQRFADNGKVITSAGLSSGMDAALHVVRKVSGLSKAKTVAMHIEYDWQPEKGFVRATMADQYYPENDYDWPAEIDFERLYNFGDQNRWQRSYRVTTKSSEKELLRTVEKAMQAHQNTWQLMQAGPGTLVWQGKGTDKARRLSFVLEPDPKENSYIFTLNLNLDE